LGLVDAPLVLAFLKSIQQRGTHEVLAKCRIMLSQIFRYGIASGVAAKDHTLDLRGAISRPDPQNRPTIDMSEFPGLFKAIAAVPAEEITRLALYWCIATACRTHEMRGARWSEIGTVKVEGRKTQITVWRVPVARMKMKTAWTQPLSPLAVAILDRARAHRTSTDPSALIFPGFSRSGTLSENALLALLARAGYYGRQTTHGFRGSFSTWAHQFSDKTMAVELCLAHRPGGVLGVYHKGEHLADRLAILTAWGEQLRELGMS
jgi:integrase